MARTPHDHDAHDHGHDHAHDHDHDHEHDHGGAVDPAALSWIGKPAPEFAGRKIEWVSGGPLTLAVLKGRTVLVDIFDFAALHCVRTLPYLVKWHERYAADGLAVVGIHVSEFPFGKEAARVAKAVRDLGIPYAVVSDPGLELMAAWRNVFWPRKWIVGPDGIVKADHIGEGGYDECEAAIRRALGAPKDGRRWQEILDPLRPEDAPGAVCYPRSEDQWCGHQRGDFGGPGDLEQGVMHVYKDAPRHDDGEFYLTGAWQADADAVTHGPCPAPGMPDAVKVRFHASEVHAVVGTASGKPADVTIVLDGKPAGTVTAGEPNLHRLLALDAPGFHELELRVTDPGVRVWSFSFRSPAVPRR